MPVLTAEQFSRLCRYVEGNALTAGLVDRAEEWRWSSLWHRCNFSNIVPLSTWPILHDPSWPDIVNERRRELL